MEYSKRNIIMVEVNEDRCNGNGALMCPSFGIYLEISSK